MIGTVVADRYRVLDKLGEGAMGEVYLAEHVLLKRREALKVMKPELADHPILIARFRKEARATNRIPHPNIVGIYDFGRLPDGRFFLTTELVEGETVAAILEREGPFPAARAVHVLKQLAQAVGHAHAAGVLHRDLKPENLALVEHRGHKDVLKIFDFGIAKLSGSDFRESMDSTAEGDVMGSAAYMSPEQFMGELSSAGSDIYAIGCLAFQLLVGEPPFVELGLKLVDAHLKQQPDTPSRRRPEARIPKALDKIVLRCLEKDPAARFASGRELANALDALDATAEDPASLASQRATLRQSIETLLDGGHVEPGLLVEITHLAQAEDDLARNEHEQRSIERRADETEQLAWGRQAILRFALAELTFDQSRTPELAEEVAALERRIAGIDTALAEATGQLTERGIELALEHAKIEEGLTARYNTLDPLIRSRLAKLKGFT